MDLGKMNTEMDKDEMGFDVSRGVYAKAVGDLVINYIHAFRPCELSSMAESEALKLIGRIRDILNEDDASDKECFYRIDEIVNAFAESGVSTHRHDW